MTQSDNGSARHNTDLRTATSTLREAIAELSRAIGRGTADLGAEIRAEVASELRAAAAEVRGDLREARHELVTEIKDAVAEVRNEFGCQSDEELSLGSGATAARAHARVSARQARAAKTRADLLMATAKLVAERGYEAASVADIAREAGYTKGALYAHFLTKDDLFAALLDEFSTEEATGFVDETSSYDDTALNSLDIASVVVSLEGYLFALRRPEYRERLAAIAKRQVRYMGRVSRFQRTGERGDPEQVDLDNAMAMASLYTMGSVMQNVLGDEWDLRAAMDRIMGRLVDSDSVRNSNPGDSS